jgi:hypothetical protein
MLFCSITTDGQGMGECEEKPRGPSDEQRFSEDLIGVRQALKATCR